MKGSSWVKLILFVIVVIGIVLVLKALGCDVSGLTPERVGTFVRSFGVVGAPLMYLAVYGQPLIPLPASVMIIVGGIAFGKLFGFLIALFGSTLRACSEFLVARLLGRDVVARLLKGKVAEMDAKVGENSFRTVLLVRLIPNFPFDVQNYGLGFSRVGFVPYALATFVGLIPTCFAFVYLGYSLTDLKQAWKLALAILIIAALMIAQQLWKVKHSQASVAPVAHPRQE